MMKQYEEEILSIDAQINDLLAELMLNPRTVRQFINNNDSPELLKQYMKKLKEIRDWRMENKF